MSCSQTGCPAENTGRLQCLLVIKTGFPHSLSTYVCWSTFVTLLFIRCNIEGLIARGCSLAMGNQCTAISVQCSSERFGFLKVFAPQWNFNIIRFLWEISFLSLCKSIFVKVLLTWSVEMMNASSEHKRMLVVVGPRCWMKLVLWGEAEGTWFNGGGGKGGLKGKGQRRKRAVGLVTIFRLKSQFVFIVQWAKHILRYKDKVSLRDPGGICFSDPKQMRLHTVKVTLQSGDWYMLAG